MGGTTLKAELDSHRQVERDLSEPAPTLRGVIAQARGDAFSLGMDLGAAVTATWALKRMRELIESPAESFSSFADRIQAEVAELFGEDDPC